MIILNDRILATGNDYLIGENVMNNFLTNLYCFIIVRLCRMGWHNIILYSNFEMSEGYMNLRTGQSYIKKGECIRCGAGWYSPN